MKILVTGHNGYIGQVMVPLLQSAGHEVTGLDTMFFEDCQFDAAPKVAEIHKDIRDIVPADLEGFDAVLFLAALSNDALGDLNPHLTFSPTYMRNATAYGLSPNLRIDLVVNNLTGYALTTGEVLMKSDGMPWRPLVHIEDISRAFLAVVEADRDVIHDQAFNVGITEENYRIREVAQMVAEVVPNSRVEFADGASPDLRNYRVNFDKIKKALPAFQPTWTVRKGVQQMYDAYVAHGLTKEEFLSSKYLRIKTILGHLEATRLDTNLRWQR